MAGGCFFTLMGSALSGKTSRSTAALLNAGMLAIGSLILIAIVLLSYREWSIYTGIGSSALRTRDILDTLGRLQADLLDAETGQRGYLLTGEEVYLEPYSRALPRIPVELKRLGALLSGREQASRLSDLNALVGQELLELEHAIDVRNTKGAASAIAAGTTSRGKQLMDRIRAVADGIQRSEQSALGEIRSRSESASQRALLVTSIGSLVLLVFLIIGNVAIARAILAKELALAETQKAQDSLKTTLTSIGDAVISTDARGHIVFVNKVALTLLRAEEEGVLGRHLDDVFRIINELTRAKVESPVAKALREGTVVGLANHTLLIAVDGTETPIDDSGAPIRGEDGSIQGTVLVFRDMSERIKAEATARLLASIVESSDDAILSKDLDGLITSWNSGAERMFGYTAEEMIGRPVSTLAPPERAGEMTDLLARIERGERVDHFETVRRTKNGNLIQVSVTISPIRDANGRIIGASKIVREITAQVRAREQIAEQRERLRVTLNSIGDGVLTTDAAGHVSYLNPVAEQLTGWPAEEAVGRPLDEVFRIVNELTRAQVENPVARALRAGLAVGLANHTLLITRQGTEIPIDDSAAPIRGHDGVILGAVLVFRDAGERRRIERELRESTARLHAALDAGKIGVWDWDVRSGTIQWSRNMEALYGLPSGAFGGTLEDALRYTHPEDVPAIKESIERLLSDKTNHHDVEYRVIWPDGSLRWLHGTGHVLVNGSGEAVRMAGLCMDVTSRKESEMQRMELLTQERTLAAERALREAEAELARITRALTIGELASSIAHEINQPLAGVVTNAQAGLLWLRGESPNVEEARESLGLIVRDANRASEVIRRIRGFLKKGHSADERFDMNETIREALDLARSELSRNGIALHLELAAGLAPVRGDRIQVQQVILNLVINGGEAMASVTGGPRELKLASKASEDGGVTVSVRDSGVGIQADDLKKMFDAFFTTKPMGMGLGLSLSRSLIESHGGRIWAEPNESSGLTIWFTLPAETAGRATHSTGVSS